MVKLPIYNEYEQGFYDAIETMNDYLERIELKMSKCEELSMLMNLMANWKNCLDVNENIKFMNDKLEKVRINFYLMRKYTRWIKEDIL